MLSNTLNAKLYADWLDFIQDDKTRDAFRYLVGVAAGLRQYDCHLQWKGKVRDFRFIDRSGTQPHAFITNRHWLLFYFRPPAVRSKKYRRSTLERSFDSFNQTPEGEWTAKLRDICDIQRLAKYLRWID